MLRPILASLLVLTALPASAQIMTAAKTYDTAAGKLTTAEVQSTFSGRHEENGVDVKNHYWTIQVSANGSLTFASSTYTDQGNMVIRGNTVCVRWEKAWHGDEQCFHYAHHGREFASYGPDGELNSTLTVTR
jgi:hypothetical protein